MFWSKLVPASQSSELEVDYFVSLFLSCKLSYLYGFLRDYGFGVSESVLCVKVILCVKTEQMGCKWF